MIDKIHWLGHAGFKILDDKVIYIDPYKIKGGQKADIIFFTHDHYDHFSKEDIAKIAKSETIYVLPQLAAQSIKGNVRLMTAGDKIIIGDIAVEAIAAYNMNKDFHPKEKGFLGYILTIKGVRIYHSGDTDVIPEMKEVSCDIALLPIGGTYTMTAQAAAEAVKKFKVKIVVPMHWGTLVGSKEDALEFKNLCPEGVEVRILPKE